MKIIFLICLLVIANSFKFSSKKPKKITKTRAVKSKIVDSKGTINDALKVIKDSEINLKEILPFKVSAAAEKGVKELVTEMSKYKQDPWHSGDLLEHSQWAAYSVLDWLKNPSTYPMVEGLDHSTLLVTTFFHDLGKAGDCIYNVYDKTKYGGKEDTIHPYYSGDYVLRKRKFMAAPCKGHTLNIPKIIKSIDPKIDIREVGFCSYMHWEFGKINAGWSKTSFALPVPKPLISDYYKKVKEFIPMVGDRLKPSKELIKLCIAVACADVAGSRNIRLKADHPHILPENRNKTQDPWIDYKLEANYKEIRNAVLNNYDDEMKR